MNDDVTVVNIFLYLSAYEIILLSTVCKLWHSISSMDVIWQPLVTKLWMDKVYIPEFSKLLLTKSAKLAYFSSLIDSKRTFITREELTNKIWSFRFKQEAGDDWLDLCPWNHGFEASRIKFLSNGGLERLPYPDHEGYNFHTSSHDIELTWKLEMKSKSLRRQQNIQSFYSMLESCGFDMTNILTGNNSKSNNNSNDDDDDDGILKFKLNSLDKNKNNNSGSHNNSNSNNNDSSSSKELKSHRSHKKIRTNDINSSNNNNNNNNSISGISSSSNSGNGRNNNKNNNNNNKNSSSSSISPDHDTTNITTTNTLLSSSSSSSSSSSLSSSSSSSSLSNRILPSYTLPHEVLNPYGDVLVLYVNGIQVPRYHLSRSPTNNWGFLFQSCWAVYTSWPLPKKGECVLLEDDLLDITVNKQYLEVKSYNQHMQTLLQVNGIENE